MTQKLEELFDLPPSCSKEETQAMETALTMERSLLPEIIEDKTDKELDHLADQAVESFENLQSLGMNVEARFSAPIFDAASKMLGHAITAKLGKVQKQLKQQELALRAESLAMKKSTANGSTGEEAMEITAQVFDRNELLKTFGKKQ
jgi:hypothetical protein